MTNRILIGLMFIFGFLTIGIVFKECNRKPLPPTVITNDSEAIRLRKTIDSLKRITRYDTIHTLRTLYRNRIDSVIRYITDSTTWMDICTSQNLSQNELECKRMVVRRLISGERDSILVGVYQRQRHQDSVIIEHYELLDTLQRDKIAILESENKEIQKQRGKEVKRKKVWRFAAVVLGIMNLIK